MDQREAMKVAELAEAEYMFRMNDQADAVSRDALGLAAARIGGGEVTVVTNDATGGFWSRAIGLGVTEPLTHQVVDEVLTFARDHGLQQLIFQVAPGADPAGWPAVLESYGIVPSRPWVKFVGTTDLTAEVETELSVRPLSAEDGTGFAHVMCTGFGMPLDSPLPHWFSQVPSWGDGWATYGAYDRDDLVATATMLCFDDIACLAGAATLPAYRGRGAQGALMMRRIRDAAQRGCRWVSAETGAETPESPNPSLHNMRRIGLTELYERTNWIWRDGS